MAEHQHRRDEEHQHPPGLATERRIVMSIALTLAFVAAEALGGYAAHSLALLSDAAHNLADALALGLSWYGLRMARRPATARRTYGFHRVAILAALVNALSLVVIALLILGEAIGRLRAPEAAHGGAMIVMALAAVAVNARIGAWLHGDARQDLNVRSAYLHMLGDALSALGVAAAGIVIALGGSPLADPIASILIAALILWSSWGILSESVDVLLEAAPRGVDTNRVEETIRAVAGVLDVHDLHVWTVGPGLLACSCHILVAGETVQRGQQVLRAVVDALQSGYGIAHSTVQVEAVGQEPTVTCCPIPAGSPRKPRSAPRPDAPEGRV
ncbi:MAG: cation transporter [Chthonomonadales bacterium]|nr:cation transporter [Chthonomonadales bacterium]